MLTGTPDFRNQGSQTGLFSHFSYPTSPTSASCTTISLFHTKDQRPQPYVLFTRLCMSLHYTVFYALFGFRSPVYGNIYGTYSGQLGLLFLAVVVPIILFGVPCILYIHFAINKNPCAGKTPNPQDRLLPALILFLLIPVSLYVFAWTSRSLIHFLVATADVGLVMGGAVLMLQCISVSIVLGYLQFTPPLWSLPLHEGLGLTYGMTLMGEPCAVCVIMMAVSYYFGHVLRARSRFSD